MRSEGNKNRAATKGPLESIAEGLHPPERTKKSRAGCFPKGRIKSSGEFPFADRIVTRGLLSDRKTQAQQFSPALRKSNRISSRRV
jgi:hypothetical protein